MFRVANLVMVVALLLTAAVVYQLKYASTAEAERLATLRTQIRKEREAIATMKAEWARRTSPIYIQGLVERHLDLKRLDVEAISNLEDLPERPAGGSDRIGGMIEALVDAPLVTSSTGKAASAPGDANAGTSAPPPTSALRKPAPPPRPASPPRAPGTVQRAPAAPPQAAAAPEVAAAPAQPAPWAGLFPWAQKQPAAQPSAPPAGGGEPLAPMLPPGSL